MCAHVIVYWPNGTDCTCSHAVQLLGSIFQVFQFQSQVFHFFHITFDLRHFLKQVLFHAATWKTAKNSEHKDYSANNSLLSLAIYYNQHFNFHVCSTGLLFHTHSKMGCASQRSPKKETFVTSKPEDYYFYGRLQQRVAVIYYKV